MNDVGICRRQAIVGAVGLGAAPLLTACGGDGGTGGAADPASEGAGGATIPTSDVPVGGGVILDDQKVVLTQPTKGEFKAFTSTCTHQGCQVEKVEDGVIACPCHGSQFSIEDGSVANGPATEPLAEEPITVEGDQITLG